MKIITNSIYKMTIQLLTLLIVANAPAYASHNSGGGGGSSSASLSTDTIDIATGETGSWTISGSDSGSSREFR